MAAIIYQSVIAGSRPVQQLGNLVLAGLSTKDDTANTDHGKLWGSFQQIGGNYVLDLYKDETKLDLVATGTSAAMGKMVLDAANGSGLSGSVNIVQYVAADTRLVLIALLSVDSDIPMNNLEALSDYDQQVGFARFHADAFSYMTDFIVGRYKSLIFETDFVDADALGPGGYNLAKVLSWDTESFRMASANYALAKVLERQYIEPGSTWDIRSKECKNIVKAYLQTLDVRFDTNADRVENKSRSLRVWKISR